ncbi:MULTISPECIES: GNAT family N-acetyltransferase [unclassified Nocardioides]|uniref:GNAT family N-acetyltransferase n=1 Tax=unclassified Nocardioides TaxID=2615069 RepID=UPI0030155B15
MDGTRIVALGPDTWPLFADLNERQGGSLFSRCWCTWFHPDCAGRELDPDLTGREAKERLVRAGEAHAALVVQDGLAVAWATYGPPEELPRLHHLKEYDATHVGPPADYRITCIQVDRQRRKQGLAEAALRGAVELIAAAGGGLVEGYPHDLAEKRAAGRKTSSSFLYNGTRTMYERVGFAYDRPKGLGNCVMRRVVAPE